MKLNLPLPAKRLFSQSGDELKSLDDLVNDQYVYVSTGDAKQPASRYPQSSFLDQISLKEANKHDEDCQEETPDIFEQLTKSNSENNIEKGTNSKQFLKKQRNLEEEEVKKETMNNETVLMQKQESKVVTTETFNATKTHEADEKETTQQPFVIMKNSLTSQNHQQTDEKHHQDEDKLDESQKVNIDQHPLQPTHLSHEFELDNGNHSLKTNKVMKESSQRTNQVVEKKEKCEETKKKEVKKVTFRDEDMVC